VSSIKKPPKATTITIYSLKNIFPFYLNLRMSEIHRAEESKDFSRVVFLDQWLKGFEQTKERGSGREVLNNRTKVLKHHIICINLMLLLFLPKKKGTYKVS